MSLPELRETYAALQAQHREEFLIYNLPAAALSQVRCNYWDVRIAQISPLGAAALAQATQFGQMPLHRSHGALQRSSATPCHSSCTLSMGWLGAGHSC